MVDIQNSDENIYKDFAFQKLSYGGFWRRLAANLIDVIILIPIGYFNYYLITQSSIWIEIIFQLVFGIIGALYTTSMHALFGATVGKMAAGLQVRKLNLTPIGWLEAIKRNSVDYAFTVLGIIGSISVLFVIPIEELQQATFYEFGQLIQSYQSPIYASIQLIFGIWFWSEVVVLLFNKKKRAIHDYIGGTVVVVKDSLKSILENVAA